MKEQIIGFKKRIAALAVFMLFAVAFLSSSMAMAAVHSFSFTAKTLPNGQLGYASGSDAEAVIPGPVLFVKQGDTIQITLTNNAAVDVGFNAPSLVNNNSAKATPGQTQNYTLHANKTGTYVYHGDNNGKELLGLFGAIIVDKKNGPVDSFVNGDGSIVPVTQADLDKQFVLFMIGSTFWGTEISADGVQKPLWAAPDLGAV
jgi:FtsP/CotA-like multicopper oxidase with cupredoxin domain